MKSLKRVLGALAAAMILFAAQADAQATSADVTTELRLALTNLKLAEGLYKPSYTLYRDSTGTLNAQRNLLQQYRQNGWVTIWELATGAVYEGACNIAAAGVSAQLKAYVSKRKDASAAATLAVIKMKAKAYDMALAHAKDATQKYNEAMQILTNDLGQKVSLLTTMVNAYKAFVQSQDQL